MFSKEQLDRLLLRLLGFQLYVRCGSASTSAWKTLWKTHNTLLIDDVLSPSSSLHLRLLAHITVSLTPTMGVVSRSRAEKQTVNLLTNYRH